MQTGCGLDLRLVVRRGGWATVDGNSCKGMELAMVPDQRQETLERESVRYDVQPARNLTDSIRADVAIVIHTE